VSTIMTPTDRTAPAGGLARLIHFGFDHMVWIAALVAP